MNRTGIGKTLFPSKFSSTTILTNRIFTLIFAAKINQL